METFTRKQCAERSGLSLRQVQTYTEYNIIETEPHKGGTGNFRRYTQRGLMHCCITKELLFYGMTMQVIKRVIATFNQIATLEDIDDAGKRGRGLYLVMSKKKQGEWEPAFAVGKVSFDELILKYQDSYTSYMVLNLHVLFGS